jgi:hypothetical protein
MERVMKWWEMEGGRMNERVRGREVAKLVRSGGGWKE